MDISEPDAKTEADMKKDNIEEIVGGKAVHCALLKKQRDLIWNLLEATLRAQGDLAYRGSSFNAMAQAVSSQFDAGGGHPVVVVALRAANCSFTTAGVGLVEAKHNGTWRS